MKAHDPKACQGGESCKPCKAEEALAELRALAAKKQATPDGRARALAGLTDRIKAAVSPPAQRTAMALLVACAMLVGCVAPEAIEQARTEAAALHGLATSSANSDDVRSIGARGSLAWRAQHRALTGDDVPGAETWEPIPEQYLPARAPTAVPR